MSRQRELKDAQRWLVESVAELLRHGPYYDVVAEHHGPGFEDAWRGLDASYQHLRSIMDDLSGEAPASASDTSIAAARSINPVGLRRLVLECIVGRWHSSPPTPAGMTCKQVEHQLRKSHESVSSAINYLRDSMLIRDNGRALNPSGRRATIWAPTARGVSMVTAPTREVTA